MAQQHRNLGPKHVDRVVAALEETRRSEYFRIEDRPNGRFVRQRGRQDPAISRAKARIRTDRWRTSLDRRGAPTTQQIGMAFVTVVAKTSPSEWTDSDLTLVTRVLEELVARDFNRAETLKTLRKFRNRLVDPADREGEPGESTGAPLLPSSWEKSRQPF